MGDKMKTGVVLGVFQSPSGVLGVCRDLERAISAIEQVVSVPFRGFRGLQAGVG